MTESFDNKFSQQLKQTDQPVSIDADALTRQLVQRRSHSKRQQQSVALSLIAGLACLMVAVVWWNSDKTNSIADQESQPPVVLNVDSPEVAVADKQSAEDAKTKLRELEQQVRSLRQVKAQQDWVLTREVVSRTTLGSQSIAPYEL